MTSELPAREAIEAEFPGWLVHHATGTARQVRYMRIPADHYYAIHRCVGAPPVHAATLPELAEQLRVQDRRRRETERWTVRSDLAKLLPVIRKAAT